MANETSLWLILQKPGAKYISRQLQLLKMKHEYSSGKSNCFKWIRPIQSQLQLFHLQCEYTWDKWNYCKWVHLIWLKCDHSKWNGNILETNATLSSVTHLYWANCTYFLENIPEQNETISSETRLSWWNCVKWNMPILHQWQIHQMKWEYSESNDNYVKWNTPILSQF